MLGVACLYVALPYWLPADAIRRRLESDLARQMGVNVSIGSVSINWAGIEIHDLAIEAPEYTLPQRDLVHVKRISASFEPLRFIFQKRLSWMRINRAAVVVAIGEEGNLSVAPLRRLEPNIRTGRLSVSNCEIVIEPPGEGDCVLVHLRDAQVLEGRSLSLGMVSVTAYLDQDDNDAPVTINFREGSARDTVAGVASMKFANVDLSTLPLWGLGLSKLGGRCTAAVTVQANRQGQLESFTWDIAVKDLDVQRKDGGTLPTIENALARGSAAIDLVTNRLDLLDARFEIGGMDLRAKGAFFTNVDPWIEGVQWANVEGRVYPEELAVLFGGSEKRAGDIAAKGPIALEVKVREAQPRNYTDGKLHVNASVHADDLSIVAGSRMVKPAGRAMRAHIDGELDISDLTLTARQHMVALGDNVFTGAGRLSSLRRFVDGSSAVPANAADWLTELAQTEWKGSWEINDLAELADLLGDEVVEELGISGPVRGKWSLAQIGQPMVHFALNIPSGTAVSTPHFTKPIEEDWQMVASGMLSPKNTSIEDINIHMVTPYGRVHVFNASVGLDDGLMCDGGFEVDRVEGLLACVQVEPLAHVTGRLVGQASWDKGRWRVDCDIEEAGVVIASLDEPTGDDLVNKAMGAPGMISLHGQWGSDVNMYCSGAYGEVRGRVYPRAQATDMEAELHLTRSERLLDVSPMLARWAEDLRLSGPMVAQVWVRDAGQDAKFGLSCDATTMRVEIDGRSKPPGVPLLVQLVGQLSQRVGSSHLSVREAVVDVGGWVAEFTGRCDLLEGTPVSLQSIRNLHAEAEVSAPLNAPGLVLVPELAKRLDEYAIAGRSRLHISVQQTDEQFNSQLELGLSEVSADIPDLINKPAGIPAHVRAEITLPTDLAWVRLRNSHIRVGELHAIAAGRVNMSLDEAGMIKLERSSVQASVSCEDLSSLRTVFHAANELEPEGIGFVNIRWEGSDLTLIEAITPGASIMHAGRRVSLSGRVTVDDIKPTADDLPEVGRVVIDRLGFEAGPNTGSISADIANPLHKPTGQVRIIATQLDDKDIVDWLGGGIPAEGELDEDEKSRLTQRAGEMADALDKLLAEARLGVHASIGVMRSFDTGVKEYYDATNVDVRAMARNGRLRGEMLAGLYGGQIRKSIELDTKDPEMPMTIKTSLANVSATESMQPQIERYFPGNTVFGTFNRTDKLWAPLVDVIANTLDARYRCIWAGSARTVTVDGMVQGQAAPSFIIKMFPDLNLTHYNYSRMTAFATFQDDGWAENDMIFSGSLYDLYMTGTTDPDNIVRYEVGLILLSTPQSPEWNHDYRFGRIPLFKVQARIVDGELVDQVVSYPWPNETLGTIFIKNNLFYRIWLTRNKNRSTP